MLILFITSSTEDKFKNVLEKKGNKNVKVKIVDIIYNEIVEKQKKVNMM